MDWPAEDIVDERVVQFIEWYRMRAAVPALADLRRHLETIRQAELEAAGGVGGDLAVEVEGAADVDVRRLLGLVEVDRVDPEDRLLGVLRQERPAHRVVLAVRGHLDHLAAPAPRGLDLGGHRDLRRQRRRTPGRLGANRVQVPGPRGAGPVRRRGGLPAL